MVPSATLLVCVSKRWVNISIIHNRTLWVKEGWWCLSWVQPQPIIYNWICKNIEKNAIITEQCFLFWPWKTPVKTAQSQNTVVVKGKCLHSCFWFEFQSEVLDSCCLAEPCGSPAYPTCEPREACATCSGLAIWLIKQSWHGNMRVKSIVLESKAHMKPCIQGNEDHTTVLDRQQFPRRWSRKLETFFRSCSSQVAFKTQNNSLCTIYTLKLQFL